MSKFDKHLEQHPDLASPRIGRTALRHALELDFLTHPSRFCLRVVLRFVKGWAMAQLLCLTVLGGFLLTGLMFAPTDFAAAFSTSDKVNALSVWFGDVVWLFAGGYGLFTGFLLMMFGTLDEGVKLARDLAVQRDYTYEK